MPKPLTLKANNVYELREALVKYLRHKSTQAPPAPLWKIADTVENAKLAITDDLPRKRRVSP